MKLFLGAVCVIFSLAILLIFNELQFPSPTTTSITSTLNEELSLTETSRSGNVFIDNKPLQPEDLKQLTPTHEMIVHTDDQASLEFIFQGLFFIALPNSQLIYTPQTKHLFLQKGEIYWEQQAGRRAVSISLIKRENIIYLSPGGRIRLREGGVEIWNYSGNLSFNLGNSKFTLKPLQYFLFQPQTKSQILTISSSPESISPENIAVRLGNPNEQQVQFTWKNVPGAPQYMWKLYPSRLREKVLESQLVEGSSLSFNITSYSNFNQLYWDVCAYDKENNLEASPSQLGILRLYGVYIPVKNELTPPPLDIQSITISGNMVLIKGTTNTDSQLFIDDTPVKVDSEGKFIHTIFYPSIGVKEIVIHVISPKGLTSTVKKQITVYDESL